MKVGLMRENMQYSVVSWPTLSDHGGTFRRPTHTNPPDMT